MPSSDTRFRPGQSGNPGGRPKAERNVRELAQQHTAEAVEALVDVVRTGKPAERVQAATVLLDRGLGPAVHGDRDDQHGEDQLGGPADQHQRDRGRRPG